MGDFLPTDLKGWVDLGTTVIGIADDIQNRNAAIEAGQKAGRVAGDAPGRGIATANQLFDEFGRPQGPSLDFQGFGGQDMETLRAELFDAGQLKARNIADAKRQEVLQVAEQMGLPSGLIAQQNALIDKWEQETVGTLAADVDNKVASILQTQYGQQNLFGLEKYDRQNAADLLPFRLAQNYAGMYGQQAIPGAQLEQGSIELGGQFTNSAGRGAATLIDSLGGGEGDPFSGGTNTSFGTGGLDDLLRGGSDDLHKAYQGGLTYDLKKGIGASVATGSPAGLTAGIGYNAPSSSGGTGEDFTGGIGSAPGFTDDELTGYFDD